MPEKTIELKIKRQDSPNSEPYWEEFSLPWQPNSNVLACLMDIQKNPVTKQGVKVAPIAAEWNCMEEICGACSMVINSRARQACSALVDKLEQPIRLQPLSKFPVQRDLVVDRSRGFEALKKIKAWVPMDGFYDLGPGEKVLPKHQETAYALSQCMSCFLCASACPNYGTDNNFIGPAAISQARLFNMHPTGKNIADERLDALMEEGGIASCGNAQVCVQTCPKNIPLTESIAHIGKQTTKRMFTKFFG